MNKFMILAGAALVSTAGVAFAQDAGQPAQDQTTASPAQPSPMTTPVTPDSGSTAATTPTPTAEPPAMPPAMPDAQTQAVQSPGAAAAPAASAPHHYPLCSRTLHDECRNPGGK